MQFDRSATPAGIVLQLPPRNIERLANQQPQIPSRCIDFAALGQIRFFAPALFGTTSWGVRDDDLIAPHREIDSDLEPVSVKMVTMRNLDQHAAGQKVRAIRHEPAGTFANIVLDSVDGLEISERDVYWKRHWSPRLAVFQVFGLSASTGQFARLTTWWSSNQRM